MRFYPRLTFQDTSSVLAKHAYHPMISATLDPVQSPVSTNGVSTCAPIKPRNFQPHNHPPSTNYLPPSVYIMTLSWFRCRGRLLVLTAVFSFGTFFVLRQYADMASLPKSSLLGLLAAAPVLGNDPNMKWFPPSSSQVNDLDKVLDGKGTWGFIYDSSHTSDDKYGTYNWCNMPHARKREYKKASTEYELQYVEVVSSVLCSDMIR